MSVQFLIAELRPQLAVGIITLAGNHRPVVRDTLQPRGYSVVSPIAYLDIDV